MWTYDEELAAMVRMDEAEQNADKVDALPIMTDHDVEMMYWEQRIEHASIYAT